LLLPLRRRTISEDPEAAMLQFRRTFTVALGAALVASGALADEVLLRGGGRVSGFVVERTATAVVIETGPGRVTLPLSRVERIVEGRSTLVIFQERAAAIPHGDAAAWAALARWAAEHDLVTQSRSAWHHVLAIDPQNSEANAALGHVSLDGAWMSADDAYRARGYVRFEGRWLTPAEHEAAVRERAADQMAELQAREADMRVREAEARAREAEARAREAESGDYTADSGIPYYPYVFGGGYGVGYPGYPGYPGYGPRPPYVRPPGMGPGRPRPRHPNGSMRPVPQPSAAPKPASKPAPVKHSAGVIDPSRGQR
jgi:hypothetical protein